MTRKGSKRKPNGNGAAQGHGSVSVSIEAAASFFEAAQHAESGLKTPPTKAGKHSCELEAWRTRDKVLAWFAKGVQADATARMTFSPTLTKQQRQDLHRLCTDFATHLQTKSIGLGDARCLVIAHPEAELGGEDPTLSDEAAATADALYRDLKAAGDSISRDEVRTRVALGELTDKMQRLAKQSEDDQGALRKVVAAIEAGNESALRDALATSKRAVRSGAPARGSGVLPLQLAVERGNEAAVRALLDTGAPLDETDGSGRTALQVARKAEQCDIEGLLLQRGAKDGEQAAWGKDAAQFSVEQGGGNAERASAAAAAAAAAMERPGAPKLPSRDSTPRAGSNGSSGAFSEPHAVKNGAASGKAAPSDPAASSGDSGPKSVQRSDADTSRDAAGAPDSTVVPGATFADALKTGDAAKAAAEKDDQGEATSASATNGAAERGDGEGAKSSTIVPGATFADAVATGDAHKAAEENDDDGNEEPADSTVVPGVSFADAVATGDAHQVAADKGLNVPVTADPEEFPTVAEAVAAEESPSAAGAGDGAGDAEPLVDPEEFPSVTEAMAATEDVTDAAAEEPAPQAQASAEVEASAEPPSYAAVAAQPPASDNAVVDGVQPTSAPVQFSAGREASPATTGTPDTAPSPESAMAKEPTPEEAATESTPDEGVTDPTPKAAATEPTPGEAAIEAGGEARSKVAAGDSARASEIQPAERKSQDAGSGTLDARNGVSDAESVPAVLQSLAEEYYEKACALYEEHGLLVVGGVVAAVGLLAFGATLTRRR